MGMQQAAAKERMAFAASPEGQRQQAERLQQQQAAQAAAKEWMAFAASPEGQRQQAERLQQQQAAQAAQL